MKSVEGAESKQFRWRVGRFFFHGVCEMAADVVVAGVECGLGVFQLHEVEEIVEEF